jgi:hypothetical protein
MSAAFALSNRRRAGGGPGHADRGGDLAGIDLPVPTPHW